MVGKYLYSLYVGKGSDELVQLDQRLIVIVDTGNQHVANPNRLADLAKIAGKIQYRLVGVTGELFVCLVINVLEIQQHQIYIGQHLTGLGEGRLVSGEYDARSVHSGVHALSLGSFEQGSDEIHLHHRLAARYGDAARFLPIGAVAERFL